MAKRDERYGFPFKGYKFLTASQLAPRDFVVGDLSLTSQGFLVDPIEGKLMRREGAAGVGSATGLLETVVGNSTPYGRQILALDSPTLTDGYPTHAVLFLDEAKGYGWLYWRSTNGAGYDLNLGENFSTTTYSITASAIPNMKWIPLWYESLPALTGSGLTTGATVSRGANEITRRFLLSGSRRAIQIGNDLFWPGYTGTPARWDRRSNDTTTDTQVERLRPTGMIPPLFPPTFTTADITATATVSPWKENDQTYYSLAFVDESGEVSMPYIPSTTALANPAGMYGNYYGKVTVPVGANKYYPFLRLKNVAIGPFGTKARLILRCPKVDSTLAGAQPNRLDLRIAGIINDNVSTTFDDYNGNDLGLVENPSLVRLDRKWPDRARYLFPFDQRVGAICLKTAPGAIIIAPTAAPGGTTRSQNISDTGSPGSNWFVLRYRLVSSILRLSYCNSSPDATPVNTDITVGATTTLRQAVDAINATTTASTAGEWAAQIVPGVDENMTSDNLRSTDYSVLVDVTNTLDVLPAAALVSGVAVGMNITDLNPNAPFNSAIPAGTYVKSINVTTGVITMSAAATATIAGDAVRFSDNTGDDDIANEATKQYGYERTFCNALPLVLYFSRAYAERETARKRDIIFTAGGPQDPAYAGNAYVAGNRRTAPADAGIGMGGAPLLDGAVTLYSRGVGRLRNIRGGKTGDDADYRNEIVSWGRGCCSPYSIVWGNGWVGYLSEVGFVVTDGQNERVISLDVYNPASKTGEWAYEIGKCRAAAESDGTDFQFYAHVADGKIWVSYRRTSSFDTPAHMLVYDFSGSIEGAGMAQVLRPDGTSWGWSTPLTYSWRSHLAANGSAGAIGSVRKSDGIKIYTCDDVNDKTRCGLIQQIQNGTWTDGADRVTADAYLALDLHESLDKKSGEQLTVGYYAPGAAEQAKYYRSAAQAGGATIALAATASGPYSIVSVPIPLRERAISQQTQILLRALGSAGSTHVHYFGARWLGSILPAYRTTGA